MHTIDWVRQFFRHELASVSGEIRRLRFGADGSTTHLISHLVEQTVRRAVLDATTHNTDVPGEEVSWRDCLVAAAFAELRSVKILARNQA